MIYLLTSATISFLVAFFLVRLASRGGTWGSDSNFAGPQKFHCTPVPRLGGIGIAAAVGACSLWGLWDPSLKAELGLLLLCSLPALVYGLAEDVTMSVSPRTRFLAATVSAFLGVWFLRAVINRTDIAPVDMLLAWSIVAVPFTIFAVAGLSNAVNIIDGFNGLASMVCMMMFGAVGWVAYSVGDAFVLISALSCIGALLGFFVWNFPRGRIFLGDGGAYFMGFILAELAVLLVHRHPDVSPWFPVLLFFYPTVETLFSIYRRRVVKRVSIATPDAAHLHSLVFRRLLRSGRVERLLWGQGGSNPQTSVYLWLLSALAVVPAALFWTDTAALVLFCCLFVAIYLWLYQGIVRFKTANWLTFRRAALPQPLCLSASVVNESAKNSSAGSRARLM